MRNNREYLFVGRFLVLEQPKGQRVSCSWISRCPLSRIK